MRCYELPTKRPSYNLHQFTRAEHAPGSPRLDCQKTMNRSGAKRAMNEEKERVNWMQPPSVPFTAPISLFWLFQFVHTSFGVCKIFEAFPELLYMDWMSIQTLERGGISSAEIRRERDELIPRSKETSHTIIWKQYAEKKLKAWDNKDIKHKYTKLKLNINIRCDGEMLEEHKA